METIKKIQINGSSDVYELEDEQARNDISQLKEDLTSLKNNRNLYLSHEYIDLFNEKDIDLLKGYQFVETTNIIKQSSNYNITGYIPIFDGYEVNCLANKLSVFDYKVGQQQFKVAVYDSSKMWIKTINLKETPFESAYVDFKLNGFIRIMYANTFNINVFSDFNKKINSECVAIKSGSITKDKFEPDFIKQHDSIVEKVLGISSTEYFENVNFKLGQYSSSLQFGSPNESTNTANTDTMFKLSELDGSISIISSNYKFSICAFNEDGVCIATALTWMEDKTELTIEDIRANPIISNFEYFTIQIRRNDSANVNFEAIDINTILKAKKKIVNELTSADLFLFMGQSNMAGRGSTSSLWSEKAPVILDDAGYEFKAITDPTKLYVMTEPFGKNENNNNGINDGNSKTGSMVTSFANAYYLHNGGIPIVGVSASQGGTKLEQWQPNGALLSDAISRLNSAISYLNTNNVKIRHKYMVWCQGESDGDANTSETTYKTLFKTMLDYMIANGVEKMFLIRIGNCNSEDGETRYKNVIKWQTEIAKDEENVVMVSCNFAGMKERGLMKDSFHYYQAGYNECGTYAGINAAFYVTTGKEPTMYDTEDKTLYYSHKN